MAEAVGILEVFGLATAFSSEMPDVRQQMSAWRFLIKQTSQCGQPAGTAPCLH